VATVHTGSQVDEASVTSVPARPHRAWFYLRVAGTLAAWLAFIVFAHALAHAYNAELAAILVTPLSRILATGVAFTVLLYFVVLSLPAVPNPGMRGVAALFVWMLILVGGHALSHAGYHDAAAALGSMREAVGPAGLALLATGYALVLALPFVPGVELGLLIMAFFGPAGAVAAYLATIVGLSVAFAIGRMLPERISMDLLRRLHIPASAVDLSSAMRAGIDRPDRKNGILRRAGALLLRIRHLTLAACLNFPGNAVLGGGGGIAFLSGMSRQFGWWGFVATVFLATSPVPLLVFAGVLDIDPMLKHHGLVHDLLTRIERIFVH
jgi:hypothetical protein